MARPELVEEGRAALRAGNTAAARRAFELAADEASSAEVVEGLARVAYVELDVARAVDGWEQAYAMYRAAGDNVGAIRVARTLSKTSVRRMCSPCQKRPSARTR